VPFIGVVHPGNPRRAEAVRLLEAHDAVSVLSDVNELEAVLADR
jgi:hypothetical protein